MTVTELGSAFKSGPGPGVPTGFMESMIAQVVAQVVSQIGVQRPPVVNVTSPSVNVAAPNVAVDPHITIQERETEPVINIEIPGFEQNYTAVLENNRLLASINETLQAVVTLLQKPVLKVVERGKGGLISEVRETRG